jgi:hypothetical protein
MSGTRKSERPCAVDLRKIVRDQERICSIRMFGGRGPNRELAWKGVGRFRLRSAM